MSFIPERIKSMYPPLRVRLRETVTPTRIYRKLSSLVTSVYLLSLMAIFYLIGTIFPQGENIDDYVKAGGKYIILVRLFNLLDFFSSPLFLLLAVILFLNLAICSYERYLSLFSPAVFPRAFKPTDTLFLTQDMKEGDLEVRRILTDELRFRPVKGKKGEEWIVMEKGPRISYRWLTWIYHAGIILCFAGILLTYLFAFEGELTLKPHAAAIFTPDKTGRFMGLFQQHAAPPGFSLLLDDFSAEYTQSPRLDYPADKLSRLATGLGWKAPAYKIDDQSMSPKAWKSKIKILKGGVPVHEKIVDVNYPLRYGGYTFYQEDFEQTLNIRVNDSIIPLETKADEDLFLPGFDTPVRLSAAKDGVLYRIDGGIENIRPASVLKRQVKTATGEKRYEEVGRVELGDSILLDGRKITLAGVADSSTLSYRYDPGAKVLWWAGILVITAMSMRFFGGWYLVAYKLDDKDRIVSLDLYVSTRGIGANSPRLIKRLESALTRNDIRPSPLPPSF